MTTEQEEAIENAESAFIAAMETGVEEDLLIDEIFDASNDWKISKLKTSEKPVDERQQGGAGQEKYSVSN